MVDTVKINTNEYFVMVNNTTTAAFVTIERKGSNSSTTRKIEGDCLIEMHGVHFSGEIHIRNSALHNINGPALIRNFHDSNEICYDFYIDGVKFKLNEYIKKIHDYDAVDVALKYSHLL